LPIEPTGNEAHMETNRELGPIIQELTELKKKHFNPVIDWYQSHSKTPRTLFRFTGYITIVLSVTIPLFTTTYFPGSRVLVSIIALLVAALTGINAFARWDSQWREYKRAQLTLEHLDAAWELRVFEARQMRCFEEAQKTVIDATRELFDGAQKAVVSETERYFENVQLPQTSKK